MTALLQHPCRVSPQDHGPFVLSDEEGSPRILLRRQAFALPLEVEVFQLGAFLPGEVAAGELP